MNIKYMCLIIDYFKAQQKYSEKYGDKTVVLYQKGSFYNCYSYFPEKCSDVKFRTDKDKIMWNKQIGVAHLIESIIRADLTRTDSSKDYSILNPNMSGFPVPAYEKRKASLLKEGYTVVRYDEKYVENKSKSEGSERFVAEITSPYTDINNHSQEISNNVCVIYLEYQSSNNSIFEEFLMIASISYFDIVTGTNSLAEFYSTKDDQITSLQEIYRTLSSVKPREVILHINELPLEFIDTYPIYVNKLLEAHKFEKWTTLVNKVNPVILKTSYQLDFFNKIFCKNINNIATIDDKIFEKINIDNMYYSRISYILLIQYCSEYTSGVVDNISYPNTSWIDSDKYLILAHNTSEQLNLITNNQKKSDTLLSILDYTNTKMGKRYLSQLIQNPIICPDKLNLSYSVIDELINSSLWEQLENKIKEITFDLEKIHRKLKIEKISPKEMKNLFKAYIVIIEIYSMIYSSNCDKLKTQLLSNEDVTCFNNFITRFTSIIDYNVLDELNICISEKNVPFLDFTNNFVKAGSFPEIDKLYNKIKNSEYQLEKIINDLNLHIQCNKKVTTTKNIELVQCKKKVGVRKQDPTNFIIQISDTKIKFLKDVNDSICGQIKTIEIESTKSKLSSKIIDMYLDEINSSRSELRYLFYGVYKLVTNTMNNEYTFFKKIDNLIAKIDCWCSFAKVANLNKYFKPTIEIQENSFVEFKDLRHPIIEKISNNKYITNDLILNKNSSSGMLLFGLNQVGKSSLVKAIALNVIMAQIGCFTACHLKYFPFKKIITRLQGGDNMSGGESTFAIEMGELRTILRQADNRSLIVGDEIAHSSDITSANGITVAAVQCLSEVNACFVFATHVHSVLKVPSLTQLIPNSIVIKHLSTIKNEDGTLIYNRKLQDGAGDPVYGVMVAESLGLPKNFISKAYSVVNFLKNENTKIISDNTSKYNSEIYMSQCAICSSMENLHSHHIEEQKDADSNGYIGTMHKNLKSNIVVLCELCHSQHHSSNSEFTTLQTSTGRIVVESSKS